MEFVLTQSDTILDQDMLPWLLLLDQDMLPWLLLLDQDMLLLLDVKAILFLTL